MRIKCGMFLFVLGAFFGSIATEAQAVSFEACVERKRLYKAGKYAEAVPFAKDCIKIYKNLYGPDSMLVSAMRLQLAILYDLQGQYSLAEPLHKRNLKEWETELGPDDPGLCGSLDFLADNYLYQRRYAEAEPLYKRSLKIRETSHGPDHPDVRHSLTLLARLYKAQGRYTEAEPFYKRNLKTLETMHGPNHLDVASLLDDLADLYKSQARYAEAETLYKRSLKIREASLGPDHLDVGSSLSGLASLYLTLARYSESELFYKRSLKIEVAALGPHHRNVGVRLNDMALLYKKQGHLTEAEQFYKRSLKILERSRGPFQALVGGVLNNLAALYTAEGRFAEAEPLYKRSLKISETARGDNQLDVAGNLHNLAALYWRQGRFKESETLYLRSLKIFETTLGPEHPHVGMNLNNLAALYKAQGRYAKAETLYKRSLKIREAAFGPDHPDVGQSLHNMAGLAFVQKDWEKAAAYWRRATDLLIHRVRRSGSTGQKQAGEQKSEASQKHWNFHGLIKSIFRDETTAKSLIERGKELFSTAQWALGSEAAGALAQMSARAAANDPELGKIIRKRQDLLKEWEQRDQALVKYAAYSPGKRNKKQHSENTARLDEIDQRISAIDTHLEKHFPDYASLAKPTPLTVREVQNLLEPKEALVLFLSTAKRKPSPEETFIWLVTKEDISWVRSSLGTDGLDKKVKQLRCGLDVTGWNKEKNQKSPCEAITGKSFDLSAYYSGSADLPFDVAIAHQLYEEFFGQIKDKINGKKLLLVPSGSLTSLPFQVLLTGLPAEGTKFQDMSWLIKAHQLTVLPSVSSLKALRDNARASKAPDPFIGFGNPLVMGSTGKDKRAWGKQACAITPKTENLQVASRNVPKHISDYFRGGEVNLTLLKQLEPLPETADELCKVADTLGAQATSVYLGDKANENEIKKLSKSGALKQAKIIHFATHGFLAGETNQLIDNKAEPSLLLTPPVDATEDNDGLLLASEVAQLKLDADWVILSACNTAGAEKPGAEPMSGLAKAFFYAGARALLISHWNVNSAATVELITRIFSAQKQDPTLGRAGALRAAMLSLMGSENMSHPEYWAPFIVVGEGNR